MTSIGKSRTNFVKIADMQGLEKSLLTFPEIIIKPHRDEPDHVMFYGGGYSGLWPSHGEIGMIVIDGKNTLKELDFSFEQYVMPFVAEGEVLVHQEASSERLNFLGGRAAAYVRKGNEIKSIYINLSEIYEKAAESFGVDEDAIAPCHYDLLPQDIEIERERRKFKKVYPSCS